MGYSMVIKLTLNYQLRHQCLLNINTEKLENGKTIEKSFELKIEFACRWKTC